MKRRWDRSLHARLIAFLTIALLPLGVIAVLQTATVMRDSARLAETALLARTTRAASEQGAILRRALGAADALGIAATDLGGDSPACDRIMTGFIEAQPDYTFAGFIEADGTMRCTSAGAVVDYTGRADWEEFLADPEPLITVNRQGEVTGASVFIAVTPITDHATGALLGGQAISIPHDLAETLLASEVADVALALVTPDGRIVASSTGMDDLAAFEALGIRPGTLDIPRDGILFRAHSQAESQHRTAAVVPLIPDRLYGVGLWAEGEARQGLSLFGRAVPLFPILMWLAGLAVAYITVNTLVLRHLARLSDRMAAYRAGEVTRDFTLAADAPDEVREIADSYNELVMRVAMDRAALEDSLREKELLLREVHHRVKNNLQLIASILNMQMRGVSDPAAKQVLKRVQDRVMSLSTIHKALYTDTRIEAVRADLLMAEIIDGLSGMAVAGSAPVAIRRSSPVSASVPSW